MSDFPEAFADRMKDMLGPEYDDFTESFKKPFHNAIRINTLKADPDKALSDMGADLVPVEWNETGFYFDKDKGKKYYSSDPLYHAGLYYIQEASAMLPAKLADVHPGEKVLDLCAAPGGKSTAAGAALCGDGILVSNDISRSRAKALLKNIENFGITNCVVTSDYPEKLSRYFPEYFDKVLVDAPCSGEGMFHKDPSMMAAWQRTGPDEYHKLQTEILKYSSRMVRPGGYLIYSTCTFSPQEDEGTVSWFLRSYPKFHVVNADADRDLNGCTHIDRGRPEWGDGNPELADTLRMWPHHIEGEGHFAALLQKDTGDGADTAGVVNQPGGHTGEYHNERGLKPFFGFIKEQGIRYMFDSGRLIVQNGRVLYIPCGLPDLTGINILRCGWLLGEIKKGRFEPSVSFAMGLKASDCSRVISYPCDSPDVVKYLKCETLEADPSFPAGWYLVCAGEYPLGWGKVSNGMLKNKYPAGWRLQ